VGQILAGCPVASGRHHWFSVDERVRAR
jgi:hypothetical protein